MHKRGCPWSGKSGPIHFVRNITSQKHQIKGDPSTVWSLKVDRFLGVVGNVIRVVHLLFLIGKPWMRNEFPLSVWWMAPGQQMLRDLRNWSVFRNHHYKSILFFSSLSPRATCTGRYSLVRVNVSGWSLQLNLCQEVGIGKERTRYNLVSE